MPKRDKILRVKIKQIASVIDSLEINYLASQKNDRSLLQALRMESLKNETLENRLREATSENRQILDLVQGGAQFSLDSSLSTVSLVHLQSKYDELLANHRGLLKVLELRNDAVKRCSDENKLLQKKVQELIDETATCREEIAFLRRKITDVKRRKRDKIRKLKQERQTLCLVHQRLVALLHRQCIERNDFVRSILKTTERGERALLLQEIRKNNLLTYENFQLQQELRYVTFALNVSRTTSRGTISCATLTD